MEETKPEDLPLSTKSKLLRNVLVLQQVFLNLFQKKTDLRRVKNTDASALWHLVWWVPWSFGTQGAKQVEWKCCVSADSKCCSFAVSNYSWLVLLLNNNVARGTTKMMHIDMGTSWCHPQFPSAHQHHTCDTYMLQFKCLLGWGNQPGIRRLSTELHRVRVKIF